MLGLISDTRSHWKIVASVMLMGVGLGWASAAAHSPKVYAAPVPIKTRIVGLPRTYTLVVVPMPAALSEEQEQACELARLKARNRRLHALVRVLHARAAALTTKP